MMSSSSPTPLLAGQPTTFREQGWSETSLHNWLCEDPKRLGLGEGVTVSAQELTSRGGGSLDILAIDGDTYFSVEVQLGEVDESHSFRVFDYWARNRERFPGKTHIAVLMAESASGRYRLALEALAETVPLMVIELRAYRGANEIIVTPELVVSNETLDVDIAASSGQSERTAEDWEASVSDAAWSFHHVFVEWVRNNLGDVRVDYSPVSYIGVWRGRRVWGPIWPVRDGGTLHLPDPDGSRDEPSLAFETFRDRLQDEGLEPTWQPGYNAGANPIYVRLTENDLEKPAVQDLLRASFEALAQGARPWSEAAMEVDSAATDVSPPPSATDAPEAAPATGSAEPASASAES